MPGKVSMPLQVYGKVRMNTCVEKHAKESLSLYGYTQCNDKAQATKVSI